MTARRGRVQRSDPLAMHPPGRCLRCDGVYRRRMGWPQDTRPLDEYEVRALPLTHLERRLRPGEAEESFGTR